MKHSSKCCKVSVSTVKKDGLMRPKAFIDMSLNCTQMPDLEFNRYILMRSCIWLPFIRIRMRLAEWELRRISRKVGKYLENLKKRQ
jgi:hypothetical protein